MPRKDPYLAETSWMDRQYSSGVDPCVFEDYVVGRGRGRGDVRRMQMESTRA